MAEHADRIEPIGDEKALVIRKRVLDRDKRALKVPLTAEEIRAASRRMGAVMRQRVQCEANFEEVKQRHKAELTQLETEIEHLGIVLDTEAEERLVECITEVNWDESTAETFRTDTHERIFTRPLTPEERQAEMFKDEHVGRKPRNKRDQANA
jgi:hypothetical protein